METSQAILTLHPETIRVVAAHGGQLPDAQTVERDEHDHPIRYTYGEDQLDELSTGVATATSTAGKKLAESFLSETEEVHRRRRFVALNELSKVLEGMKAQRQKQEQ